MRRKYLKYIAGRTLRRCVGRGRLIRIGRIISDFGALVSSNDMESNGEALLQRHYLAHVQRLGPVVLDIGAHRGRWTTQLLSLARVHDVSGLNVTMFEADPLTHEYLAERIAEIGAGHVVATEAIAVSSFHGTAPFARHEVMSGINSLVTESLPSAHQVTVAVTTLDEYCRGHGIRQVGLTKVDTEGNDFSVLVGASNMLSQGRIAFLQFEYNHRWIPARHYLRDVFGLITAWPYRLGRLTPEGIEYYSEWSPGLETYREGNYVLSRLDVADKAPTL